MILILQSERLQHNQESFKYGSNYNESKMEKLGRMQGKMIDGYNTQNCQKEKTQKVKRSITNKRIINYVFTN